MLHFLMETNKWENGFKFWLLQWFLPNRMQRENWWAMMNFRERKILMLILVISLMYSVNYFNINERSGGREGQCRFGTVKDKVRSWGNVYGRDRLGIKYCCFFLRDESSSEVGEGGGNIQGGNYLMCRMLAYLCRYCVSGDDHGGASNTCSWMLLIKDNWIYYVRERRLDMEGFAGQGSEGISMDTSCNLTVRLNSVSPIWGLLHDYLGYWFANGNDKRLQSVDFQIGQSITIMDCFRSTNLDAHVYSGDATWAVLFSPWQDCYEVSFLPMHVMLSLVSSRIDFMVTDGWSSWLGMDLCSTRLEARVDKGWPIWSHGIR
ncbi:hypothetical protein R6Q59_027756 [Mikania micrantha]